MKHSSVGSGILLRIGLFLAMISMALTASGSGARSITFGQKDLWLRADWYQHDGHCLYAVGWVSSFEQDTRMMGMQLPSVNSRLLVTITDVCTGTRYRYSAAHDMVLEMTGANSRHGRLTGDVPAELCVIAADRTMRCEETRMQLNLRWDALEDPRQTTVSEQMETPTGMYMFHFTGDEARADVNGTVTSDGVSLFFQPTQIGYIRKSTSNSVTVFNNL